MRIELSHEDAERVRGALQCLHGGKELDRLADLFLPAERVTAEVREHVWRFTVGGEYRAKRPDPPEKDWRGNPVEVAELDDPVTEELLTCPKCGGTTFGYRENCVDYRTPWGQGVQARTVTVYWSADGTADSGDSDPGLFCDDWEGGGCGVAIDLPDGWEVDYQ